MLKVPVCPEDCSNLSKNVEDIVDRMAAIQAFVKKLVLITGF